MDGIEGVPKGWLNVVGLSRLAVGTKWVVHDLQDVKNELQALSP